MYWLGVNYESMGADESNDRIAAETSFRYAHFN